MELILRHSTDRPRLFMALCLAVILSVSGLTLWISAGASLEGLISALCGPTANAGPVPLLAMWMAMTLAMMIPSATPMIATYLDIAEAAAAKRITCARLPEVAASPRTTGMVSRTLCRLYYNSARCL